MPAGTARPVTSITLLCSTAFPSGPADIPSQEGLPQGWDAPYPETASGSHGEKELPTPGGEGDVDFASDCGHPCSELSRPQPGAR